MEVFSYIVLLLLSLFGYSAGGVGKAGKSIQLKPQIIDLVLVSVIWAVAIYSRVVLDFNKWLMILAWVIISISMGIVAVWPRRLSEEKIPGKKLTKETPRNVLRRLWQGWASFSKRAGDFQSRVLLSVFFFILVSPFALAVKIFSDPLRIKYRSKDSLWSPKPKTKVDLEQFRRQF